MEQYLFDSGGNWIAYRKDRFLFSPNGQWLGWVESPKKAYDVDGHYLGDIISDRIFRPLYLSAEMSSDHPGYPGWEAPPDHPGYPGRFEIPAGMEDVRLFEHA